MSIQPYGPATPVEAARHHIAVMHDFEATVGLALARGRDDDLVWRRRRIEGHALRAIVAMLETLR